MQIVAKVVLLKVPKLTTHSRELESLSWMQQWNVSGPNKKVWQRFQHGSVLSWSHCQKRLYCAFCLNCHCQKLAGEASHGRALI